MTPLASRIRTCSNVPQLIAIINEQHEKGLDSRCGDLVACVLGRQATSAADA
jgi:hypothetical protein